MRKIRNALIILLALFIIVAGALLPFAASEYTDKTTDNAVSFEEISTIQLNISNEEEERSSGLPILAKLASLGQASVVQVSENFSRHTREEILGLYSKAIAPYLDAGLVSEEVLSLSGVEAYPTLIYSAYNPEQYFIVWALVLEWEDSDAFMHLYMDDETGTILFIDYQRYDGFYSEYPHVDSCEWFCNVYLSGLISAQADAAHLQSDVEPAVEWSEIYNSDYYALRVNWGDMVYGEVILEFIFSSYGFYMTII